MITATLCSQRGAWHGAEGSAEVRAGWGFAASGRHQLPCKPGTATLCRATQSHQWRASSGARASPQHACYEAGAAGSCQTQVPRSSRANLAALVGVPLPAHTWGWGKQKARVSCDKDGSQFPWQSKVRGSSAALALIGTGPCTDTLQTARRALQRHPAARQPCRPEG